MGGNSLIFASDDGVPWWTSTRVALAVIGFLGFANMYALRLNMNVALLCMVNHTGINPSYANLSDDMEGSGYASGEGPLSTFLGLSGPINLTEEALTVVTTGNYTTVTPENVTNITVSERDARCGALPEVGWSDGEFPWDADVQTMVIGSFFWGYILTQIPGAWLSAKVGGKKVFGWFMFVTAVSTIVTPVGARMHYKVLVVMRVIAGFGQGVAWPAMHTLWGAWAPPQERGRLIGFTYAGCRVGNLLTVPVASLLCQYGFNGGWPSIFYIYGALGVVWFLTWMAVVYELPSEHPRVSEEERVYIYNALKGQVNTKQVQHEHIPWLTFFMSLPVWSLIVVHFCADWGTIIFFMSIPKFLNEMMHVDIKVTGYIFAVTNVIMCIMINVWGLVSDIIVTKELLSITNCRKVFTSLAMFIPGLLVIGIGFLDCTTSGAAIAILFIGVAFLSCQYSAGFVVNHVDIAPRYAGLIFGVTNTIAIIPRFVIPSIIDALTKDYPEDGWRNLFFITFALYFCGAIFYITFGSGEVQEWARVKEDKDDLHGQNFKSAMIDA